MFMNSELFSISLSFDFYYFFLFPKVISQLCSTLKNVDGMKTAAFLFTRKV